MLTAALLATLLQAAPAAKAGVKPTAGPAAGSAPAGDARGPQMHGYGALALSPDGARIATVEENGADRSVLTLRAARDGAKTALPKPAFCRTCRLSDLAWSPDGAFLAFIAHDEKAATVHLGVLPVGGGGGPREVATLKGLMASPRWSGDGRTLAVLATANPRKQTGATQAGAAIVGEVGSAFDSQRIATVPAAGGALSFASPDGTFVYEYDWTPDGRGFVGTAAKGDGDDNWWVAKLESFGLDGAERVIASPDIQMDYPRVSPDGRTVAFIGGLMSDFGSVGGDLYTVPLAGGTPRDLTPDFKGSFTSLSPWRREAIRASALMGADHAVVGVDPSGAVKVFGHEPVSMSAGEGHMSFSADETVSAAVIQDFEHPAYIGVHDTAGSRRITHDNDALIPNVRAQSVTWTRDGFSIQGWLLAPPHPRVGRAPLLVQVHGGPAAASTPRYLGASGEDKQLLDRGYYILLPNPRGSYGQGEAFTAANKRDFGGGDLQDILAGADAAAKVAPVDLDRMGIYGGSYGGFMSMWAVTHTDRFKASVASAGLSNWSSYYGTNGIDKWMIPYFGKSFYEDPAIYDKLSAVRYVKDVRTPTLIMVGERDIECPPGQSIEFWHGLKEFNVPTTLVIYEGEGHGIRDPKRSKDAADRRVAWFDKYLAKK